MAKQSISQAEVQHIAQLTKLTLTADETSKLADMFTETLDYINVLDELDTSKVSETFQVTGLTNVFQDPNAEPTTLSQTDALKNASEPKDNLFGTKGVFDEA